MIDYKKAVEELFFGLKLTEEQIAYKNAVRFGHVVFVQSRAGSGKTTVGVGTAKLLGKELHYIFPTVQEKALGFSTGDVKAKERKYITPLLDALVAINENPAQSIHIDDAQFGKFKNDKAWVHAYSHNYMRGSNLDDCVVIIDEAQNLTKKELRTILTRIKDSCAVIIMGDFNQCDIKEVDSGFIPYLKHYETTDFTTSVSLTKNFRGRISAHAELI